MSAGEDELPESPFDTVDDGTEPPTDAAVGPMERLFDGDAPGPSVGELRADYDMPQWMAVTARGVLRVATGSGIPPVFEIAVGSVMGIMGSDAFDGFGSEGTDGGDTGDDDDLPNPDEASPPPVQ